MKPHVKYEVGDGKSIFLWHDRWWDGGILSETFPTESLPNPDASDVADKTIWMTNNGNKYGFHIVLPNTHMHTLANKRLSTQDRLSKWYLGKQVVCPLCELFPDSHEHLFFKCSYSTKIWTELKRKMILEDVTNEWDEILNKITAMAYNNFIMSIRIVLAASVSIYGMKEIRDRLEMRKEAMKKY
ncbi:reverse transcriptase zinc-binding domain-containing protein [Tanacetum coccineum]